MVIRVCKKVASSRMLQQGDISLLQCMKRHKDEE
ncbi:hypothetical protein FOQG_10717 [Fusarium oxysporum f. sp. raphani 54005]|uniref:Uncharacterized protein n=7 Tax=Fusarium oxysporum TaxID=5507 RepID=W9IHL4_FUSOX|nr:hypothetical protein FOXG_18071 [Fusarium oxysporum f. sp. lycopersici 4287]EWY92324.1 hypothetical protein FOYG_05900 [Fusarium oxysporum NRRL 32931]EWZ52387.1 hypothetical protein FOZG_02160 [Fusarium oxysporum Fo47]EWZ86569.1 hypothetical protein FOWG_10131 [Fusarium oxysporum f. sp. lycopersici MN25]EXA51368.1 hypothetical protein FOVG_00017 [Fusarium oxysporum f. sp. pisi HDV247]EXK49693.1 hypothetical protein FOMG_02180 [Fusarium oxysporum f. sp. melonis 26406]EXK85359.1 hypothetical